MHSAREGLIAHLDTRKATLGVATVKKFAGEFKQAIRDRSILLDLMPAVLIMVKDGLIRKGHGHYEANLIIVSDTNALELENSATDALLLAETTARDLETNVTWTYGGREYVVNTDEGFAMDTLLIEQDFTAVMLSFDLKEL